MHKGGPAWRRRHPEACPASAQRAAAVQTGALLWLAGYAPDVFDAVADAVQPFSGDGSDDPEPICSSQGRHHGSLN